MLRREFEPMHFDGGEKIIREQSFPTSCYFLKKGSEHEVTRKVDPWRPEFATGNGLINFLLLVFFFLPC